MKTKNIIVWLLIALVVMAAGLWLWNNYQIIFVERTDKPIQLPWQKDDKCGIQSCHGLEISCGANVPEMCTMEYQGGDNCRQLAVCQVVDGQCTQADSPRFEACKACVEQCELNAAGDSTKFFECESQCAQ